MRISVIVPVYNVEKYIHRCVDSILTQTFAAFDLILVDDGSPDHCGAICDEYAEKDSRIHVIHRENGGLSAARNSGIDWALANSDSQYLTFIDSDDWVHPQFLESLISSACAMNAPVSMAGMCRVTDFDPETMAPKKLPEAQCLSAEELFLRREDFNYAWGKLYSRELFRTLRYPEGKVFEDVFTTYRALFAAKKIALVDEPLYFYYYNQEGISHSAWKPTELVIFEGMRQQMDFYRANGHLRAFEKEEKLYVGHHGYQLIRIRENRQNWKEYKPLWKQVRREMRALMKESGGKYTYKTMPYCAKAAFPRWDGAKALVARGICAWKRYGFRGGLKRVKEKLGG